MGVKRGDGVEGGGGGVFLVARNLMRGGVGRRCKGKGCTGRVWVGMFSAVQGRW